MKLKQYDATDKNHSSNKGESAQVYAKIRVFIEKMKREKDM